MRAVYNIITIFRLDFEVLVAFIYIIVLFIKFVAKKSCSVYLIQVFFIICGSSFLNYMLYLLWLMSIDVMGEIFVNIFVSPLLYGYITRGHTESLRDISSRAYLSNNQTLWHYISHHSGPILDVCWHVMLWLE